MTKYLYATATVLCVLFGCTARGEATPLTVDYLDPVTGWEWADLTDTLGLTWLEVSKACPQDGVTACTDDIGAMELPGWIWATQDQVRALFDNATDLTAAQLSDDEEVELDSTWAPQFLARFSATFPTVVGDLVSGWSATAVGAEAFQPFMIDAFGTDDFALVHPLWAHDSHS